MQSMTVCKIWPLSDQLKCLSKCRVWPSCILLFYVYFYTVKSVFLVQDANLCKVSTLLAYLSVSLHYLQLPSSLILVFIIYTLELESEAIDGEWGSWQSWTACSNTCGGGSRSRQRTCSNLPPVNGGKTCTGSSSESSECNTNECKGKFQSVGKNFVDILIHISWV